MANSSNWFKENWDKVLGFVLSIIVAGVVGFFSAIRATEGEISTLRLKIVALETDSKNLIKPKLNTIDNNEATIQSLVGRLAQLEKENDIHRATYNLLSLSREEERRKTIIALKELLQDK